jgi:Uma2 family endonuclease
MMEAQHNKKHQDIFTFLLTLFNLYLGLKPIGTVLAAAFSMVIGEDHPAREPDVVVVLNAHRARIQPTYLDGPADMAVEIVSPESSECDRGVKFHEYEAVGVQEYWLIDPLRQEAAIYALGADGRYHRLALDADGRLISALLPGFALDPGLFWNDQLPAGAALIALAQEMAR